MNQTPPLLNSDLLVLMTMEITLWFALAGLVCFLVMDIRRSYKPSSRRKQANAE